MNIHAPRYAALALASTVALTLAACASPEAPPPAPPDGSGELAYKWRAGETLRYHVTHASESSGRALPPFKLGGEPFSIEGPFSLTRKVELELRFDVRSVDSDGSATVEAHYEAVQCRMTGSLGDIAYDSRDAAPAATAADHSPAQAIRAEIAKLAGETIRLKLGPDGGVRSADAAALVSYDPWRSPAAAARDVAGGFLALPLDPVRPGATWTGTRTFESLARFELADTYTLAALTPDSARIEATTKGTLDVLTAGTWKLVSLAGAEKSDFDRRAGRLRRSERHLALEVAGPPEDSRHPLVKSVATRIVELR